MKNFIIFAILIFTGCDFNNILNKNSLEIFYMNPGISTPASYSCNMINDITIKKLNYQSFNDSETLSEFMRLYNDYEIDSLQDSEINARIKIVIKYDHINDTICLGEHFDTFINGTKYKDNEAMLCFIKQLIKY